MSLDRCIPDLLAKGKLSPDQAKRAEALYGERKRLHEKSMGAAAAEAAASAETVTAIAVEAARKKRLMFLGRQVQKDRLADMASFNGGRDGPVSPDAATALIDRDHRAPYSNVEARRKAIKGEAHAEIDRILHDHRRTLTGALRNKAQMDEIGRALFGATANIGIAARELADAWGRVAEMLRLRFNAAGGNIDKLKSWGLPQSHDARLVRNAGRDAWMGEIWDRLDRSKMIDEATGLPFTDEGLRDVLFDVFETIRTDGAIDRTPGGTAGARSLANRRAEHRFLHFKSYDDWAAYQARFGAGTAFDAMMGHIEAMSRDIAAMEVLGPNPEATIRWLKDSVGKQAKLFGDDKGRAVDRAHAGGKQLQRLWDEYTGALRRPENRSIALVFGAIKSVQTAAKLGSATLSSVSDLGTQAVTRSYNGLPVAGMIGDYARLIASEETQRFAIRRGLIADEWAQMTAAQNRYLAEELTGEVSARLADGVLRASGLSAWTQAGRWAFGMEFLDTLQGQFGKRHGELDGALRAALERYGFGAAEWDAVRATKPSLEHQGEMFFRPQDVADKGLGGRLLEMIQTETDYAVPVADLRTRALINSVAPKGTIVGELARSAFLFKSFGISIALSHGRRALSSPTWAGTLGYASALTVATMIGGAIGIQLKEIAKGKDPRPMVDPAFAGAAILQGGGFGIFGDFFGSSESRFGQGFAETAAGPLFQTAQNVANLTVGNAMKARRGDPTHVGRDFSRLLSQEVPGSSLWYLRLAYQRGVVDQLQMLADPGYRDSWRRMDRRAREQGQEFFWAPGETAPERAPDFANAFEGGTKQ